MSSVKRYVASAEAGQASVEFALVAIVLALLLTVPVDLFRYAQCETALNSAATEAASQLTSANLTSQAVFDAADGMYGDRLTNLAVASFDTSGGTQEVDYDYQVYSSDKKNEANPFEERDSNYHYRTVSFSLSCQWEPITFLGAAVVGGGKTLNSQTITRDIYINGYEKQS